MRKLWRHWYGKLLVVLPILLVVFAVASLAAASYTERSSFCVSACHEMNPYGVTWKTSVHRNVACVKCHIKPGFVSLVKAKGSALREVYVHFAGEVKAPIAVTEHVPSSTCRESGCHSRNAAYDRVVLRTTTTLAGSGSGGGSPGALASPAPAATALLVAAGASPQAAAPASPAPPVVFSHDRHTGVQCIECHDRVVHRVVPGRTYVDPRSMTFCMTCHDGKRAAATCQTCHAPPHEARGACTDCHVSGTWASDFKHPVALGPSHQALVCEKCHTQSTPQAMGFASGCVSCHAKRHATVSITLCAKCHVPTHFKPSTFKHPRSGCESCHKPPHPDRGTCLRCHTLKSWANRLGHPFPLAGTHTSFVCEKCHTKGISAPGLDCSSCHRPPHSSYGNCLRCHTMTSFASHFSHPLRLSGTHTTFTCEKCHTRGISQPGLNCDSCHHRPHNNYGTCLNCHTMTSFASRFSHPVPLGGRHSTFACEKCHTRGISQPGLNCDSCHHRPHPYYGPCLKCHSMTSFASSFSHPFKLAGVHTTFACSRCHVNGIGSPGVACTSCHGSNHGGLTNCAQCHTQAGWTPTTFSHGNTGMEGWQRMACSKCHPNNQFAKVYCSCHNGKIPSGD